MTKLPRARGTAWSRCRARLQRPGRLCHDLGSAADGAAIGRAVLGQAPVPWREKSPLKKWGFRIFGQERMGIQDAQGLKKSKEDMGPWDCTSKSLETDFPLRNCMNFPVPGSSVCSKEEVTHPKTVESAHEKCFISSDMHQLTTKVDYL